MGRLYETKNSYVQQYNVQSKNLNSHIQSKTVSVASSSDEMQVASICIAIKIAVAKRLSSFHGGNKNVHVAININL